MRGRLGEGTTDDSRYRPQTVAGSVDLTVEPVKNRVAVTVEHPESARPGATVDLTITLRDEQKQPLAGEVTLWLVDAAVLSLAKEGPLDPLSRFVEPNPRSASVRDTRNTAVGRLLEQEEEPGGDGEEGEGYGAGGGLGKARIRKLFLSVPYYQATLQVPASGKLVVPVKLSDDLTDFKVRAVAASGQARFGLHQSTLHVRLPVLVQPQLPRLVRAGDRFWPGGVARLLEGAEGPATVDVRLSGAAQGKATLPVKLEANKPVSGLTPVTVGAITAAAELSAKFINDRHLPDKAIDVIDEAGAAQRILPKSRQKKTIGKTEVEEIIAKIARIPPQTVSSDDRAQLKSLDRNLKNVVFGQDPAIDALSALAETADRTLPADMLAFLRGGDLALRRGNRLERGDRQRRQARWCMLATMRLLRHMRGVFLDTCMFSFQIGQGFAIYRLLPNHLLKPCHAMTSSRRQAREMATYRRFRSSSLFP